MRVTPSQTETTATPSSSGAMLDGRHPSGMSTGTAYETAGRIAYTVVLGAGSTVQMPWYQVPARQSAAPTNGSHGRRTSRGSRAWSPTPTREKRAHRPSDATHAASGMR